MNNIIDPEMIGIIGGTFLMGSPVTDTDRFNDETQHIVDVSSFGIGKYPVTQKLWVSVMGTNPSEFKGDNLPVENVSWEYCFVFIQQLNLLTGKKYRLPTEAEWEYAARGGNQSKGYKYAGSDDLNEVGWYDKNSKDRTHKVGWKKSNELGIYDMSGNVLEWCNDWYGKYPQNIPTGTIRGRILRGGSWCHGAYSCRTSSRYNWRPDDGDSFYGFRLACD